MKIIIITSIIISFTIFCMEEPASLLKNDSSETNLKPFRIRQLLKEIKKYNDISPGSIESYFYPLSLGSINFTLLYMCYAFKEAFHKFEQSENDQFFTYISIAGFSAGSLLYSMPLVKMANYKLKKYMQQRKIYNLIKKNVSQHEINQMLTHLELDHPLEIQNSLGLKEEEMAYLIDCKPFLETHNKKIVPLISLEST